MARKPANIRTGDLLKDDAGVLYYVVISTAQIMDALPHRAKCRVHRFDTLRHTSTLYVYINGHIIRDEAGRYLQEVHGDEKEKVLFEIATLKLGEDEFQTKCTTVGY